MDARNQQKRNNQEDPRSYSSQCDQDLKDDLHDKISMAEAETDRLARSRGLTHPPSDLRVGRSTCTHEQSAVE